MRLTEEEYTRAIEAQNSLEHYGRKGMRWGQNIFGKERKSSSHGVLSKRQKERAKKRQKALAERKKKKAAQRSEREAQNIERKKKREIKRKENILRNPTKLYKHRYEFTQDEINDAIKRFEWEAKLNELSVKQLQRGKNYLDTAFNTVNSGINLYNAAARIANTFNKTNLPYVSNVKTDNNQQQKKDDNKQKRSR